MIARPIVLGAAIAVAYITAIGLTAGLHQGAARPLYEGFAPAPAYPWVNPPPAFAAGNTVPKPEESLTNFGPKGFPPVGLSTANSEVILDLSAGAITPQAGATAVRTRITPLDPATLGSIASTGLVADGNAWRFELFQEPMHTVVAALTQPGQVLLGVPNAGHRILYSTDGQTWTVEATRAIGNFLQATFPGPGWYLAVSQPSKTGSSGGGGAAGILIPSVIAVIVFVALLVAPRLWRRRRVAD